MIEQAAPTAGFALQKCTRDAIRDAPEYREDRSHRDELDVWYGKPLGLGGGGGWS